MSVSGLPGRSRPNRRAIGCRRPRYARSGHTHTHTHTHIRVRIRIYTLTYTRIRMRTRTRTRTCTHIRTRLRLCLRLHVGERTLHALRPASLLCTGALLGVHQGTCAVRACAGGHALHAAL